MAPWVLWVWILRTHVSQAALACVCDPRVSAERWERRQETLWRLAGQLPGTHSLEQPGDPVLNEVEGFPSVSLWPPQTHCGNHWHVHKWTNMHTYHTHTNKLHIRLKERCSDLMQSNISCQISKIHSLRHGSSGTQKHSHLYCSIFAVNAVIKLTELSQQ